MTFALAVLTGIGAALPLGVAWAGKRIVDSVVAHDASATFRFIAVELAFVAGLALSGQGLSLIRSVLGARLALDVNLAILDKALGLELRHFEDPDLYDRLTRARREASSRPLSVVMRSFQLLQSVLTLLGYVVFLVHFSVWAVVVLLVAAVPAALAEIRFSAQAFRIRNWRSPEARRLMYVEHALANDSYVKEVKLFGLGPLLFGRYRDIGETFYEDDRRLAVKRASFAYGLSLLATAAFYGAYASMAIGAALGKMTLGEMTLYMVAFRQGQQAFQSVLGAFGGMVEDNLYMSNLFDYLSLPTGREARHAEGRATASTRVSGSASGSATATATASAPPDGEPHEAGIRFEDVGFRYPGREVWALRHVDLFVPAGESLALVGQNGAGKTTFIKLLTRLYDPSEGRILLDGRDLRDWDEGALRRRIGVIFQDFNQYQFSIRENVGFGSVEEMGDDAQVNRAVVRGGADEVVSGLSEGLDTGLGRWFKGGVELSGGQWQKIALSRAFMRENADILVLDEPTAALDAEAEHAVFERFRALTRGRTSILISHRFPTVRMADRIVVVEGGRVLEQGTHDELVRAGGRYAMLFRLQAAGYLDDPHGATPRESAPTP
jgi:ATP-binding cassette subfamily B protein